MSLQKLDLPYLKQSCHGQMGKYIAEGKDKEVECVFALFRNVLWKIVTLNFI